MSFKKTGMAPIIGKPVEVENDKKKATKEKPKEGSKGKVKTDPTKLH